MLDREQAHMYPPIMPLTAAAQFANAGDVDTVIVNGKIRMRHRKTDLDERAILTSAAQELTDAIARCGLEHLLEE